MIVYKQIRLKRIVISTTSTVTNAAVSIVTREGGVHIILFQCQSNQELIV